MRSFVNMGWICNDSIKNFYLYANNRYVQFNNDILLIVSSFFQSLISKSLALTSVLNIIQNLADNDLTKFTYFGRITKLLITFDPAVVAGLRSSQYDESEQEGGNAVSYIAEVLAGLGAAQKIINVDER